MADKPTTHEVLIQAIMDYYNTNERWEAKGFDENGRKLRSILSDIRKLCTQRRYEIQDRRKNLKAKKKAIQNQDTQD
jgi:hypothetical protein